MSKDVTLFNHEFGDGKFSLTAQTDDAYTRITSLTFRIKFGQESPVALSAKLASDVEIDIPVGLIDTSSDPATLISRDTLKNAARYKLEELDALRTKLQQSLADQISLDPAELALGGIKFDSLELRLAPGLLDAPPKAADDTVLVGLTAVRKIDAVLKGQGLPGDISGTIVVEVAITPAMLKDATQALCGLLRFELPALPAFDLNLPRFKMPNLSLHGIALNLPDWTFDWPSLLPISLPRVPGLGLEATWEPVDDNKLKVEIDDGNLLIKPEKEDTLGTLKVSHGTSGTILTSTLENLTFAEGKLTVDVDTELKSKTITLDKVTLGYLPVKVVIDESELDIVADLSANPVQVTLTHRFGKISIRAHDDPDVFLHLALTLVTTITGDGIDTKVTALKILEPYPLDLLADLGGQLIDAAGASIRLIGQVRLPDVTMPGGPATKLRQILSRLLDLMEAAMRWLGDQAAAAGKAIAGAAEAVAWLIRDLIAQLATQDTPDFSFLAIEVRLNPNHWRLEQIIVTPAGEAKDQTYTTSFLGIDLSASAKFRPALVLNFAGNDWYGLALLPQDNTASVTLATDLWLKTDSGPQKPVGTLSDDTAVAEPPRLVQITAKSKDSITEGTRDVLVLAAVQDGKLKLFQTAPASEIKKIEIPGGADRVALSLGVSGALQNAMIGNFVDVEIKTDGIKERVLALMPKSQGDGSSLLQKIKITDVEAQIRADDRVATLDFKLQIKLTEDFVPEATFGIAVSLTDFSAKITAGDRIAIRSTERLLQYKPLGLDVRIAPEKPNKPGEPQKEWEVFALDLKRGGERFALGKEADATVAYRRVSNSGQGLVFTLKEFAASRSGFDLEASVKPDNPVTLGGVDVPFRFTSGDLSIAASRFKGASLAGSGQLPPALIGEANASIALQLGEGQNGSVEVLGATARLDKSGDPIRCSATMFELTITELGFDFVNDDSYHFYFLLTGSAAFRPEGGLFDSGLLKNFKELEIKLDKAPLGGDPRVLMRSLSFLVKVDPPKQTNLFDLFRFDLKGIGFYPSAEKFGGDPAMAISGQVKFAEFGDKISPRFDFHKMWIAGPSHDGVLPRVRFDGLGVGLKTGAIDVEATAIAVDDKMPDLYRTNVLPANVRAKGFLAKGRLDIKGWASMSAAMGFLQLNRRDVPSEPRHAFFMYGQLEKLTEPIDTPVGRIYLREAGFGFGYRYTLAGIAQADTAKSPRELVRILDEVSKYQGSLNQFEAWEPTYDNNDLTLALRGMFSIGAHYPQPEYSSENERDIPNPLLFDIVAALRTDLTFLINLRGWIATNYNDWVGTPAGEAWKSNPSMRGYLYFSVPRKEFLARAISERGGHVGKHPDLPKPLVDAIQGVSFSSTLYIRPGLFHMEFGWPYELGVELGNRDKEFWLTLKGGLINRIEDFSLLYGMAFKADGGVRFGGRIGNDNFGASASAYAIFALEAKIISYLSLQRFSDSMFYGLFRFDATLGVSVSVWISFRIFRKRIRLSVGFSLHLAMSIALEAVITPAGLGGRAQVAVGVRAFGRTLSVGIGIKFNDGLLNQARARVARFQALGLGTDVPPASEDGRRTETLPRPTPPRPEIIAEADARLNDAVIAPPRPTDPKPDDALEKFTGELFAASQFWAMLFPIGGDRYLIQFIPRDGTIADDIGVPENTFFSSPGAPAKPEDPDSVGGAHHTLIFREGLSANLTHVPVPGGPAATSGTITVGGVEFDTVKTEVWTEAIVQDNAGEHEGQSKPLKLGHLLATLFLRDEVQNGDQIETTLSEPRLRQIGQDRIDVPDAPDAAAEVLGDTARSRETLIGQERREAEIEEARSAVIAAIMDTAEQIAAALSGGRNPARIGEIDARDFGLTFTVHEDALNALFEAPEDVPDGKPRAGHFTVAKSDAADAQGDVYLFNPPERMFRTSQPRLRPVHDLTPEGIKLNWDLEPAWLASVNFYDDPEYHLRRYVIRRRITGLQDGEDYAARFECKAATPMRIKDGTCKTTRAPYQFVDDLRRQNASAESPARDIPEEVRNAILGRAGSMLDTTGVQVEYDILPIDIAGTGDVGEPYTVPAAAPVPVAATSPIEATLQIVYSAMPSLAQNDDLPVPDIEPVPAKSVQGLRLMLRTPPPHRGAPTEAPALGTGFDLRILREAAVPSGGFGSDAVSEGRNRLGEDQIERLNGPEVATFRIRLLKKTDIVTEAHLAVAVDTASAQNGDGTDPATHSAAILGPDGKEVGVAGLITAMGGTLPGIDNFEITGDVGRTARLFLRTRRAKPEQRDGEWRHVSPNIVIGGKRRKQDEEQKLDYLANNAVVETFERPVALEFRALHRQDIGVRSGRLHMLRPTAHARLEDLLGSDKDSPGLQLMPDPARRTATRVRWNVRASSLALWSASGPVRHDELFRWVSGFSVHQIDPDAFVGKAKDIDTVVRQATDVGEVRLLPATERGLLPDRFGDMERLEFAFPSTAWRDRMTGKAVDKGDGSEARSIPASGNRATRPWFSAAETTAHFPRPQVRRTLLPDFDEGLLAELFAEGPPDRVIVEIPAWADGQNPVKAWVLNATGNITTGSDRHFKMELVPDPGMSPDPDNEMPVPFTVDALRRALRGATFEPEDHDADLKASTTLMDRAQGDPGFLRHVILRLTAQRARIDRMGKALKLTRDAAGPETVDYDYAETARVEQQIDLLPQVHPVLADVLALLPFDRTKGGLAYRRYSVVPDDTPPSDADSFVDYLDALPPERDPHGFAALRTLGLAAGFQLYDTDEGAFLRGEDLFRHIDDTFKTVLRRYGMEGPDAPADKGLPFVDVLTRPWGTARLFWFDGGQEEVDGEDVRQVKDEALAAAQITLRPVPDRIAKPEGDFRSPKADMPVRLWRVVLPQSALDTALKKLAANERWTDTFEIRLNNPDATRLVDGVAPPSGIEALPVHRFTKERPLLSLGNNLDGTEDAHLVYLRVALLAEKGSLELGKEDIQVSLVVEVSKDGEVKTERKVITEDVKFHKSAFQSDKPGSSEPGLGRFTELEPDDWADILFRPDTSQPGFARLSPVTAFQRLDWYATRRFGAIALPVGVVDQGTESPGTRSQRSEIAQKVTQFWQAYLTHCAIPEPKQKDAQVHLSLGTIADPGTWEQAPDSQGRVSIVIPDASHRGARRAYAVRPLGRYDDWTRANTWQMRRNGTGITAYRAKPVDGLKRALEADPALRQFGHVTLPRTEPLEKPVILSSRRIEENEGLDGRGRFEVAVAHPSDMVLAAANRRNTALMAPQELSVGLWREYAHGPWVGQLKMILKDVGLADEKWNPMAAFGHGATAPLELPENAAPPNDPVEAQLTDLRSVVPDAWRGTTVFSFDRLPWFFRMHVLVHSAAGIVVSEQAATRFEEGFPFLVLPWADRGKPLTTPSAFVGYRHRTHTHTPVWSVLDDTSTRRLSLTLPLTRIIDATPPRDANLWFGATKAEVKQGYRAIEPFTHMPEPLTSYRITLETLTDDTADDATRRTLARTDEIDIRPLTDPTQTAIYRAEPSGSVLALKGKETSAPLTPTTSDGLVWMLPVALDLPEAGPMSLDLSKANGEAMVKDLEAATAYHAESATFGFGYHAQMTFGAGRPNNEADWEETLATLVAALKAKDMAKTADDIDALFAKFDADPDQTQHMVLPSGFWAEDLADIVKAFFGIDNDGNAILKGAPWCAMRRPATDTEITEFIKLVPSYGKAADLATLMTRHLLGARRHMAMQVLRGTLPPISGLIRHALTVEDGS